MAKCSRALKDRVIKYTQTIFNNCIMEVFELDPNDEDSLSDAMFTVRLLNRGLDPTPINPFGTAQELLEKRDKVETMYQEKIKMLSTKQLNEIIKAHTLENGINRSPKTIETIVSELARRSIFDDSGESELKENNGDVDGPRNKSSKHRSKTTDKRRKATKSR